MSTFDARDEQRAAAQQQFGRIDGVPRDRGGVVSLRIAASRKPVIAAINGPAVGIGVTMTLPADVRIAHRLDSRAIFTLGQGPDAAEGVTAFLEKRPPEFPAKIEDYLDVVPSWPTAPEPNS